MAGLHIVKSCKRLKDPPESGQPWLEVVVPQPRIFLHSRRGRRYTRPCLHGWIFNYYMGLKLCSTRGSRSGP